MRTDGRLRTIVQVYGCRWPAVDHSKTIDRQIWLQQQYFNMLAKICQERRRQYRQITSTIPGAEDLAHQLDEINCAIDGIYEDRNAARSESREMIHFTDTQGDQLNDLKQQRKAIYAKRKSLIKDEIDRVIASRTSAPGVSELICEINKIKPSGRVNYPMAVKDKISKLRNEINAITGGDIVSKIEQLNQLQRHRVNEIWWNYYKGQGLTPGNRAMVSAAIEQADGTQTGPQWRKWTGEGSICVEFTNKDSKPSVEQLLGGLNNRVQIAPVPVVIGVGKNNNRSKWRVLRIKIGTEWIWLPMTMHCPLPPDSKIASVKIVKTIVGGIPKYECHITLITMYRRNQNVQRDGLPHWTTAPIKTNGLSIGMDAGWRAVETGLRGYTYCDSSGNQGHMMLPSLDKRRSSSAGLGNKKIGRDYRYKISDIRSRLKKSDDIRSIRDGHFNELKKLLSSWVNNNDFPEWLRSEVQWISRWRAQSKGARLLHKWQRFQGDDAIYSELVIWNKKDRHLWQYEANTRSKALRQRREMYRIEKCRLSKYENIFVENFDLRGVISASPYNRSAVCLSQMRAMIMDITTKVDGKNTTLIHNNCGHKNKRSEFDDASALFLECQGCGVVYDRDLNAAKNILARGLALVSSAKVKDISASVLAQRNQLISLDLPM